ncbi:MAG: Hsp70 family protein, partial [Planctomycetales bacterium]
TLPLVDRTRFTASHLLKEAGSSWTDLTRILLVGGSTRMPMVSAMLKQESGLEPDASLSADESVAHGAALYAGLLLSQQKPGAEPTMSVRNVNSHALGVLGVDPETGMSRASTVIPKNTPLPTTQGQRFQTARDGQRNVMVNIIEGGDASGKNGTPIGKCVIKDLPENLPAGTPVEVYFRYRPNGRLTVHARVPQLERDAVLELERASGMTETNLQEWDQFIHHPNSPLRLEG